LAREQTEPSLWDAICECAVEVDGIATSNGLLFGPEEKPDSWGADPYPHFTW
jgi:hypothetical protein